ncbi:MAG: hypothetical protein CMJ21_05195 [Phycisphaerae bacterium]|nr:hypothetical protein [Phycisphaerae bacterium]
MREVGTTNLIGPPIIDPGVFDYRFNAFLLDTGANATLAAAAAHFDGSLLGGGVSVNPNLYPIEQRTDPTAIAMYGTDVTYFEQGIAGLEEFNVLAQADVAFAGHNGSAFAPVAGSEHTISSTRALGAPTADFGGFAGIVGMTGQTGRHVVLDLTTMTHPVDLIGYIGVDFPGAAPATTANTYTFDLLRLPSAPTAGQVDPSDPVPDFVDLPLIQNVGTTFTNPTTSVTASSSGTYLVDTGAQFTIITQDTLNELGVDISDPAHVVGTLEVGGVGGTTDITLVRLDEFILVSNDGTEHVFDDLTVGVLDIPGLPVRGILGMNVLTTGYWKHILARSNNGAFDRAVFDFTGTNWTMQLDANPDYIAEQATYLNPKFNFFGDLGILSGALVSPELLTVDPTAFNSLSVPLPAQWWVAFVVLIAVVFVRHRRLAT